MSTTVEPEVYAKILEELAQRIRSGEAVVTGISQSRGCERWWHQGKWEYFGLKDVTMSFSYHEPEHRLKEEERKKVYLETRPKASFEDTWPVVALNGVPRGACYDYSVEEGWIEYLVPKSGIDEDYKDPNSELELRRYHGEVKVLGHMDPNAEADDTVHRLYRDLPPDTTMFPTEDFIVMPWKDPNAILGKKFRIQNGSLFEIPESES